VGLVVPGPVAGVAHETGELALLDIHHPDQPFPVLVELGEHLVDLGLAPWGFTVLDDERLRSGRGIRRHRLGLDALAGAWSHRSIPLGRREVWPPGATH